MPADLAEELLCPLCDYSLQGLVEPRCPECGYGFTWEELRDPTRRNHPYLFEHHPRRNFRSFRRTLAGGMRPTRFWGNLFPTQPVSRRRLILYHLLILLPAVLALVLQVAGDVIQREQFVSNHRAYLKGVYSRLGGRNNYPGMTLQQVLDRFAPQTSWREHARYTWQSWMRAGMVRAGAVVVAWPWLTLAAFMIFRISMRRARIHPVHVVRCLIYCSDVMIWINLFLFSMGVLWIVEVRAGTNAYSRIVNDDRAGLILFGLMVLAAALFLYRMSIALRMYLRFDHPRSTLLATQVLVGLAVLLVLVRLYIEYP